MEKDNFKKPSIVEGKIDPLSARLLQQNNRLQQENNKLKKEAMEEGANISLGNLKFDLTEHTVFFDSQEISLSNREYDLLLYLARNPNRNVSFEELGNAIWGTYLENDKRTLMVIVSRLRKKMQMDLRFESMLESIRGVGYKMSPR